MSTAQFGDAARDNLRVLIAVVERELALLPPGTEGNITLPGLRAAWGNLVGALALGPANEYRACPHCQAVGMSAASRCSRCWAALVPMIPGAKLAEVAV